MTLFEALLTLALVLALAGAAALAWLLGRINQRLAQGRALTLRLAEMLGFAPNGYYCWDVGGGETCSRRLAVMLGLRDGTATLFDAIPRHFGPLDGATLAEAAANLRHDGQGFVFEMPLADGSRRIRFTGQRIADAQDRVLADVLWAEDITQNTETVDRLSAEMFVLLAERDRLRGLLNALPMPVWLRDGDLRLAWCNRAYAQAVDAISPAGAVADGAELVSEAATLAQEAKREGQPRGLARHRVVEGSRRLFEILESPLTGGSAGLALDATRLEETKAELARHIEAHAAVLERLAIAIAIFGADTRLVFHNQAFLDLWKLEKDWLDQAPTYVELLETLRVERRLPEQADFSLYRDEELRRFTGLIEPFEDIAHLPDGRALRRLIAPHPFGGLLFTYEDVTDTLALERSYNTLIAVHRETLDHLREGVAVFGPDGALRLFNRALARLWAIPAEELERAPRLQAFLERLRPLLPEAGFATWRERLERAYGERAAESMRLETADGRAIDQATLPLPDGGLLVAWSDATDSARVERALRERGEALEAANHLKSEFIANVSAELRAPLETVLGHAALLATADHGPLSPKQADYVAGVLGAAKGLKTLIDDIVDLATIEAGRMTLELDTFDINALLAAVLGLVREAVKAKSLTLDFDAPSAIGWMAGDERRLKQVLYNLLSNAVKFTPAGGTIGLSVAREEGPEGNRLLFRVADTGIGIPEAEQARLAQSLDEGRPVRPGAGLGLVLVKRFVELMGGTVEIASAPGRGTTVTLSLPGG
ncbi:MAG: PAS-domain containing protein [Rhodospirillales bacterium]|nr:PAS-domain containing protein [Rhodospirillales bacterium]